MGNCNCNCNCSRKPGENFTTPNNTNEARTATEKKIRRIPIGDQHVADDAKSNVSSLTMVTMEGLESREIIFDEDEQYLGEFDLQPSAAALMEIKFKKESRDVLRQKTIERVGEKGSDLDLLEKEWKDDKGVVLTAVTNNGCALQYASEAMKADKEVVIAAVTNSAAALEYASNTLKSDLDVVGIALRSNGMALMYCSDSLKANIDIVTIAIKKNGSALEYANEDIRRDKKMVLLAVDNNPSSLEFAMNGLNEDKDCLKAAGLGYKSEFEQKNKQVSVLP